MSDIETTQTRLPVINAKAAEMPKPIVVQLTAEQEKLLSDHFRYVRQEFMTNGAAGRGMLIGQIWGPSDPGSTSLHSEIRAGYLPTDRALLMTEEGYGKVKADRAERDALRAALAEIVYEYRNSYDADCEPGGSWKAAASLPVDLMERAAKLVGAP